MSAVRRPGWVVVAIPVLACACGPRKPPRGPRDPKTIATELDAEMNDVAHVLHVRRAACPVMASELRAVFARMGTTIARAHDVQRDDAAAKQLVIEMRAFDQETARRQAAIDRDFTADAPCARDPDVRAALMSMPTL